MPRTLIFIRNVMTLFIFLSGGALADPQFCLVNSLESAITISHIETSNKSGPVSTLQNKTINPLSISCWELSLDNQFNIEVTTDKGILTWHVDQEEAIGRYHKIYDTIKNTSNYTLLQKAGDNDGYETNLFILEEPLQTQKDYLSNWLSNIPDTYTLKDIQLIGTHDSGVNIDDGINCDIFSSSLWAITQKSNLLNQLYHGIRFFDIRLEADLNQQFYPFHKYTMNDIWHLGCSSKQSFETSLKQMIDFIKQHPKEFVFIKISHSIAPGNDIIAMLDRLTTSNDTGRYFYKADVDDYRWSNKPIADLRGKIIIFLDCEFANSIDPKKGYFNFSTSINGKCDPDDTPNKILYSSYTNTKYFSAMEKDQIDKLKQYGNLTKLFYLAWIITGGDIVAHTPRATAVLLQHSKEDFGTTLPLPNIISYDFEDPGINKMLIKNFRKIKSLDK